MNLVEDFGDRGVEHDAIAGDDQIWCQHVLQQVADDDEEGAHSHDGPDTPDVAEVLYDKSVRTTIETRKDCKDTEAVFDCTG